MSQTCQQETKTRRLPLRSFAAPNQFQLDFVFVQRLWNNHLTCQQKAALRRRSENHLTLPESSTLVQSFSGNAGIEFGLWQASWLRKPESHAHLREVRLPSSKPVKCAASATCALCNTVVRRAIFPRNRTFVQ